MKPKLIKAEELDRLVDEGKEDVLQYFDLSKARRIHPLIRRVNVDFPYWMVHALDDEAERLGITRQSVIKTWIGEKIAEKTSGVPYESMSGKRRVQVGEPPRPRYRAKKPRR